VPRSPLTRRLAQLVGGVAVLVAGAACAVPGPPQITFYADRQTVAAGPVVFCSIDFTACEPPGQVARLTVPPGYPLQVSLPTEIADAPWRMITVYLDASGTQQVREQYYRPGARLAVTVRLDDPASTLQGVEIQLPSGFTDAAGKPVARGAWSIRNDYTPHG
jgi:hypothetical protein